MTQSETYTVYYDRCDGCGSSTHEECNCEQYYPVQCSYLDTTAANNAGVVVSSVTQGDGTLHTLQDGSTYYQSNSGW